MSPVYTLFYSSEGHLPSSNKPLSFTYPQNFVLYLKLTETRLPNLI